MKKFAFFALIGLYFGVILTKGEVIAWFRIQEMFRLQSFHMYGFILSAIGTSAISIFIIRKFDIKNIYGESVYLIPLKYQHGNLLGGMLYGMGWGLVGTCPGPLFALVGSGWVSLVIAIFGATLGTLVYGIVHDKLPH